MYRGSGQIFANKELIANAYENATVVPSCNIPHLPMMAPITITNSSKTDPIVMLKYFGPDNPDLDLI